MTFAIGNLEHKHYSIVPSINVEINGNIFKLLCRTPEVGVNSSLSQFQERLERQVGNSNSVFYICDFVIVLLISLHRLS